MDVLIHMKTMKLKKGIWRSKWVIDKDIPIFKGEGRKYIDKLVFVGE